MIKQFITCTLITALTSSCAPIVPMDDNKPTTKAEKGLPLHKIILERVKKTWTVPQTLRGMNYIVSLHLKLDQNGNVIESTVLDKEKLSDPLYKTLADSAQRAVKDPRFTPLPLDINKHEQCKDIILMFNPKDIY